MKISLTGFARTSILAFVSLGTSAAIADGKSAAYAYFRNLQKWSYETNYEAATTVTDNTLVNGVYRLEETSTGKFIALITESGNIKGGANGWYWIEKDAMRELNNDELKQLRSEVMHNISWDKLVKVTYGNGGGRRIVLVSAVNCPYCAKMEANLARHFNSIQTTFYVLPTSLVDIDEKGGREAWLNATKLWCAADAGAAWRRFWVKQEVPKENKCPFDEATAQNIFRNFGNVMSSIDARVHGTPAMIREDGKVLSVATDFDDKYINDVLGPEALRHFSSLPDETTPLRWLASPR
jgi:hypothetical protein